MPKAFAVLVKSKTEKGHAGAGLAVLVPLNANAAADPACDAAAFYKGPDGKPLLVRTKDRRVMENDLRRAERLHLEGNKHRDVQEGRVADARAESRRITEELSKSFTTVDPAKANGVVEVMSWSTMEARLAAESNHAAVAVKALKDYIDSMDVNPQELLRIACVTKHAQVSKTAVETSIKEGATLKDLMTALDSIPHEGASLVCYEAVKKASEPAAPAAPPAA